MPARPLDEGEACSDVPKIGGALLVGVGGTFSDVSDGKCSTPDHTDFFIPGRFAQEGGHRWAFFVSGGWESCHEARISRTRSPLGLDAASIDVATFARDAEVGFVGGEVAQHSHDGLLSTHETDGDTGARLVTEVVVRAVEWVDDPVEFFA